MFHSLQCNIVGTRDHTIFPTSFRITNVYRGANRRRWDTVLVLTFDLGTMACGETETQSSIHGTRRIFHSSPPTSETLLTQKFKYGCNPTGMTATLQRRKEVLRLAREHNFIILEGELPCFYPSNSDCITYR